MGAIYVFFILLECLFAVNNVDAFLNLVQALACKVVNKVVRVLKVLKVFKVLRDFFSSFRLQRYADLPFLAIRKNYDFALSEPIPTYLIMMKLMPLEHECSIFSFQFSIKILTFAAK